MITTMIVDCGPLGEIEWTIDYKYHHGFMQTMREPGEREFCQVNWIKIGGERGFDISNMVSDDYIYDEVRPHCLADYHSEMEYAMERKAEEMREARRAA